MGGRGGEEVGEKADKPLSRRQMSRAGRLLFMDLSCIYIVRPTMGSIIIVELLRTTYIIRSGGHAPQLVPSSQHYCFGICVARVI